MGALGAARLSLVIAQSAPRPDEIFSFLHPVRVACALPTTTPCDFAHKNGIASFRSGDTGSGRLSQSDISNGGAPVMDHRGLFFYLYADSDFWRRLWMMNIWGFGALQTPKAAGGSERKIIAIFDCSFAFENESLRLRWHLTIVYPTWKLCSKIRKNIKRKFI